MPDLNWKKISEIKHALAQQRTIICGCVLRLKSLKVCETIERMERCDQRLKELDCQLVDIIESANGGENGLQ